MTNTRVNLFIEPIWKVVNLLNVQRADVDTQKYQFQVTFPHMHIHGNYSVDGKILRMIIKGHGDFDLDICKYLLR